MRIRTVDAFTDRPFTGNPAAVVLLESGPFPDDERLQRLANEMNLAETAYAHPLPGDEKADWALRWFTPVTEVNLCGHGTLATAHALRSDGTASGTVRFRTRSGILTTDAEPSPAGEIVLGLPTAPLTGITPPEDVTAALGAHPVAAYGTGPLGHLLLELSGEKAVRALTPDLSALLSCTKDGVIVTAAADAAADGKEAPYDYVSRMFAPGHGIPEDPVTGSAHTALAPLWSGRFGRDTLRGRQVSARTGDLRTTLRGERTEVAGRAVTVLDGELRVEL